MTIARIPRNRRRSFHRRNTATLHVNPFRIAGLDDLYGPSAARALTEREITLRNVRRYSRGVDILGRDARDMRDLRAFWGLWKGRAGREKSSREVRATALRFEGSCVQPIEDRNAFYATSNALEQDTSWEECQRRNVESCLLVALEAGRISEAEYTRRIGAL